MADLKVGNKILVGVNEILTKKSSGEDVKFIVPSGAVAGTLLNCSQYKTGTYNSNSSRVTLEDLTINIGFKPKVFFIHHTGALYTGLETPFMLTSSIAVYHDDDSSTLQYTTFVLKGDSTNGYGRSGVSNGNGFMRTDTGVKGFGTTVVTQKNTTYNWYAWG